MYLFQFHTGTIITMAALAGKIGLVMFQFHTGTIITPCKRGKITLYNWFQFHTGTIITSSQYLTPFFVCHVSIPHWYDYNRIVFQIPMPLVPVSIPHWYDYNETT